MNTQIGDGHVPLKTSGAKEVFATGSHRDVRTGKGRFDLVPFEGVRRVALRYEAGADHYGDRNWELGQPLSRMLDSSMRHLMQALDGQEDEDHLAAAAWGILGVMHIQREIRLGRLPEGLDDLPRRA